MGGGDLNMKKSWHPLLMKNQERVWLKEKEALAEKKKLEQLRKELEEERQLQELQRLQEEQTGKKRQDKLDWMYATPATGGGPSASDLEEYLLGKKRVDKILIADENEKVGASHKNFIAVQNANTARDTAAKIREDPLFAIKQQEQAALKDLMANPLRLKAMKEKAGIKEEGKKHKEKHKHKHRHRDDEDRREKRSRHRSRSRSPRRSSTPDRRRSPSPGRYRDRRSRSPPSRRSDLYSDVPTRSSRDTSDWSRGESSRRRSPSPNIFERRSRYDDRRADSRDSHNRPPTNRSRASPSYGDRERGGPSASSSSHAGADRAARLAAMSQDASSMEDARQVRLAAIAQRERVDRAEEEAARMKNGKHGKSSFVREQEKMLYGGDMRLDERIQRNRAGLVREVA